MSTKNAEVEAYMKEHGVSRATAHRKLKPGTPSQSTTVSRQPSHGYPPIEDPVMAALIKAWPPSKYSDEEARQKRYGRLVWPPTETFTLTSGKTVPIYRREYPGGDKEKKDSHV